MMRKTCYYRKLIWDSILQVTSIGYLFPNEKRNSFYILCFSKDNSFVFGWITPKQKHSDEKQKHNRTQGTRPQSLTKIQDCGFKLKETKCAVFAEKIKYLG